MTTSGKEKNAQEIFL